MAGVSSCAAGQLTVVEGEWPHPRLVVIEFPSRAAAEAWYRSPAYQQLLPLRLRSSVGNLVIVDGVGLSLVRAHIVCAHPEPSSYNAHLAATARQALEGQGWSVTRLGPPPMGFDPCERASHYADRLDPSRFDVQGEQRHASQNQHGCRPRSRPRSRGWTRRTS